MVGEKKIVNIIEVVLTEYICCSRLNSPSRFTKYKKYSYTQKAFGLELQKF